MTKTNVGGVSAAHCSLLSLTAEFTGHRLDLQAMGWDVTSCEGGVGQWCDVRVEWDSGVM